MANPSDDELRPPQPPRIEDKEELLREILRRVPVKPLMRFKCVSKLWRSIILDPSFARSYIGGSRGILISQPLSESYPEYSPSKNFYFINMNDTNPNSKLLTHYGTVIHGGGRRLSSTEVVNGLVCFFEGNYSCLYNVSTRECRDLPLSHDPSKFCSYYLGFNAVSKLYKLLKICAVYDNEEHYDCLERAYFVRNLNCEVLTLGVDASWRIIGSAPWQITTQSKCFNGVIYWSEDGFNTPVELIAFHLDQEKFEFIPRIRVYNRVGSSLIPCGHLPNFGPALALTYHYEMVGGDGIHRNVIFPYCNTNNNNSSLPIRDRDWCADGPRFNLPAGWGKGLTINLQDSEGDYDDEFAALGALPDGRVFIMDSKHFYTGLQFPASFYLYCPVEKMFTKFVILQSQSPPCYQRIGGHLSYHEENIISLISLGYE